MHNDDVSPARQQYLEIKREYPNTILFFRLGDFYETFDEDAELTARDLDIVLTTRSVGKGVRAPLAGIPYHAVENYLARLIEEQQVTTVHFVPAMLQAFVEELGGSRCGSLKRVICSGEALPYELTERFFARSITGYKAQVADASAQVLLLVSRDLDQPAAGERPQQTAVAKAV